MPRALRLEEISSIVADYRTAAENAQAAGGPIENRARLMFEAVDAAISVWGAERVGLHLAPRCDAHDRGDSDPLGTFSYVAREARKRNLAFLFAREHQAGDSIGAALKREFGGIYVANERFTVEQSAAALSEGSAEAIAFGVKYIAHPDLVGRLRAGAALNELDRDTMYTGGMKGYSDYPVMTDQAVGA